MVVIAEHKQTSFYTLIVAILVACIFFNVLLIGWSCVDTVDFSRGLNESALGNVTFTGAESLRGALPCRWPSYTLYRIVA